LAAKALHECIYCRRLLSAAEFNREHVISDAFGTFEPDTPVLHNAVCRDCNQHFGDHLEVRYTRGAIESLLRYYKGLKTASGSVVKLPFVEVKLPPGTDWSGVRLGLRVEDSVRIALLPQVAFRRKSDGCPVHITAHEIERGALDDTSDLDTSNARFFTASQEERDFLISKLREQGIAFTKLEEFKAPAGLFDGGDVEVELTITVNKGIRRCVAKFAFNYLVYECGVPFGLRTDFDPIRRFIRYGEIGEEQLVVENARPALTNWMTDGHLVEEHVVAFAWVPPNGLDLVGQITLFNFMSYNVMLARGYGGLVRPAPKGLRYDIRTRRVRPLIRL